MPRFAATYTRSGAGANPPVTRRDRQAGLAPEPAGKLPLASETIRKIQSALRQRGFYEGPVDGIVGPATERAIAAYQQRHGLSQAAALELQTLQSLITEGASGSSTPR